MLLVVVMFSTALAAFAVIREGLGLGFELELEFKPQLGPTLACELELEFGFEFVYEHGLEIELVFATSVSGTKAERWVISLLAIASAAARPMTTHSSKELLAKRFAPCKPVQATSPTAYKPATVVRPDKSVSIPPQL